jgi:hypothetical protein
MQRAALVASLTSAWSDTARRKSDANPAISTRPCAKCRCRAPRGCKDSPDRSVAPATASNDTCGSFLIYQNVPVRTLSSIDLTSDGGQVCLPINSSASRLAHRLLTRRVSVAYPATGRLARVAPRVGSASLRRRNAPKTSFRSATPRATGRAAARLRADR